MCSSYWNKDIVYGDTTIMESKTQTGFQIIVIHSDIFLYSHRSLSVILDNATAWHKRRRDMEHPNIRFKDQFDHGITSTKIVIRAQRHVRIP